MQYVAKSDGWHIMWNAEFSTEASALTNGFISLQKCYWNRYNTDTDAKILQVQPLTSASTFVSSHRLQVPTPIYPQFEFFHFWFFAWLPLYSQPSLLLYKSQSVQWVRYLPSVPGNCYKKQDAHNVRVVPLGVFQRSSVFIKHQKVNEGRVDERYLVKRWCIFIWSRKRKHQLHVCCPHNTLLCIHGVSFPSWGVSSTVGHQSPPGQLCVKHTAERLLKGSYWGVGESNSHSLPTSLFPVGLGIGTTDLPHTNLVLLPLGFHHFISLTVSQSVLLNSGPGVGIHSILLSQSGWNPFLIVFSPFFTLQLKWHSIRPAS